MSPGTRPTRDGTLGPRRPRGTAPPPRPPSPDRARHVAAILAALLATSGAGCAPARRRSAAPHVEPPVEADRSPRHDVRGLPNLGRVDDGLWRSGQPEREGYAAAKALGVRTVVDLRGSKVGPAGARTAGLELVPVRTSAKRMDEDDVVAFLRVATDPARRPVLVHCASGHDRTGAAVAAYRRVVDGWSADQALREMRRFGAAPWYGNLVRLIEDLDPAAIRARLAAPAAPDAGAPARRTTPEAAPGPDDDDDARPTASPPR